MECNIPIKTKYTKEDAYMNYNMEWCYDNTIRLIKAFKNQEALWNTSKDSYKDKKKKEQSWMTIEKDTGVPVDMCKKRIESLFASARRERMKIIKSKEVDSSDEVYKPTWLFWKKLTFMPFIQSIGDVEEDNLDEETSERDVRKPVWALSTRRPPRIRYKKKPQELEQPKLISVQKRDDEFDAYGITVAAKLRKMDPHQKIFAENIINKALYKGLTFQLSDTCYGVQ